MVRNINLDARELATILHGLRMIQADGRIEDCAAGMCAHFDYAKMLTDAQIDKLCKRINFPKKHPPTDLHRAGCNSCMMAHDKALPNQ